MRKQWAFVLFLVTALQIHAQLPSGSIAPDFKANDINGQSWHLYDLLDSGKIVVLEISATWCPPCWAYHNGHAMHHFYEEHGPGGDNKARVLFIEGDPNTNTNCLYGSAGCNNYTPGNWVAGTPFPIIDNAKIADTFQVNYYPTIFVICPNRKVYEVGQWNAADLWKQALTCPVAFGANNAGIFDYTTGAGLNEVCGTTVLKPAFSLVNLGSEALTQATVSLQWNNTTQQTYEWTGNLGLYGEIPVAFDELAVHQGGALKTRLISINNAQVDDDTANNVRIDSFTDAKAFNSLKVLLKIHTDQYGAETYWELRDDQGKVLEFGGNQAVGPNGGGKYGGAPNGPGAYSNNVTIRDTLNLPGPGCYSLHFVDAYGDGMCCAFGNGYYKLYNLDDPNPILSGGAFRAYDNRGFSASLATAAGEPVSAEPALLLFPNPATDRLHLGLSLPQAAPVAASVINALGQLVFQRPPELLDAGEHQREIDLTGLPEGFYWLHLQADRQQLVRKFLIRRR